MARIWLIIISVAASACGSSGGAAQVLGAVGDLSIAKVAEVVSSSIDESSCTP